MFAMDYGYVGRWRGPRGVATAELIAPEWIITAPHVVSNKIQNPHIDITVCFENQGEKISASVAEAYLRCWKCGHTWEDWKQCVRYEWKEVALARLAHRIDQIAPVGLADSLLVPGETTLVKIVTAMGTSLEAYCRLADHQRFLVRDRGGGKEGDSGGAWLKGQRNGREAVVGIIQGTNGDKAVATQPAVWRNWIDMKLGEFGANVNWVNVVYS